MGKREAYCNFCGQSKNEVGPLVEGKGVSENGNRVYAYICASCVEMAGSILESEHQKTRVPAAKKLMSIPTPRELYDHLNAYVIGQDSAKRKMSVQVSNHYRRLVDTDEHYRASKGGTPFVQDPELRDVVIEKSNLLLFGPTGSGKTLLARSLAERLNVPFAIGDATTLTEAGYVGEDVENLLLKLLATADYDIDRCERGIIYIDELDKVRKTGSNVSITRDVSGEGVQQSLLKMVEGTIANVPPQGGRKHPEQQYIQIDTTNILFICGGAFVGLDDIIAKRLSRKSIGFANAGRQSDSSQERNELLQQCTHDDLIQYGIIPELAGRLPVLAPLNELSVDDLVQVLTQPRNALLKQERKKLAYQGVKLEFTDGAIREIAEQAHSKGTGARALRTIVEDFMTDIQFDLSDSSSGSTMLIDENVVKKQEVVVSRAA